MTAVGPIPPIEYRPTVGQISGVRALVPPAGGTGPPSQTEITSGFTEALAADTFYRVIADTPTGPLDFGWVQPCHTRPSAHFAIRSAKVTDKCVIGWIHNEAFFFIWEGLAEPDPCDGDTPPPAGAPA